MEVIIEGRMLLVMFSVSWYVLNAVILKSIFKTTLNAAMLFIPTPVVDCLRCSSHWRESFYNVEQDGIVSMLLQSHERFTSPYY